MPRIQSIARCACSDVGGRDLDRAVVLDVDLAAGLLDDLADHLAAGADHLADLLLRHVDDGDARRGRRHVVARAGDRLGHLAQDVHPPVARLRQRDAHDLGRDRGDLDVHLQRGDAALGAGHLEVHVAEMVLVAQDVGQHGEAAILLDQAHGDARHRPLQRHAGVHQRERAAAHRGHRGTSRWIR